MVKRINCEDDCKYLPELIEQFEEASCPMALTGAGISVGSGIPDFRSPGGLWSRFSPDEYATLEIFLRNPVKAWELYRAMGRLLVGKRPNPAHHALADLEEKGMLQGIVTQNVDNLHQLAGSQNVLEIHGDHMHLQCLQCGELIEVMEAHYHGQEVVHCHRCDYPLKPNVVLFGENVRSLEQIHAMFGRCDLLMVVGTSAQVYPASELPSLVKGRGGLVCEFNREQTRLSGGGPYASYLTDYFIQGDVCDTLPHFVAALTGTSLP